MIGILYESSEWSDFKLAEELAARGEDVRMIDMAHASQAQAVELATACDLLVSRVFASAVFRGHAVAHERMAQVIEAADRAGTPMVNPARAHFFEIDKARAVRALASAGIDVPRVQACGVPGAIDAGKLAFPCVIKPNCGGRTTHTAIARSREEAEAFLAAAPEMAFVVEDYIAPERGFVTRIELVDGACALAVKRSVVDGGLSAYHLGSTYEIYDDCAREILDEAQAAGRALGIRFGSFDLIEHGGRAFVIDANSVSNVSPDNTETFGGFDLMAEYAAKIAPMRQAGEADRSLRG